MILFIDGDPLVYAAAWSAEYKKELKNIEHSYNVINAVLETTLFNLGATEWHIYLTGKGNYRLNIDPEYKANRRNTQKPQYYAACRNYMIDWYDAVCVDGQEADDEVSIQHMYVYQQDPTASIIVSIDKDLNNTPGIHYNYNTKLQNYIHKETALLNFYKQMLIGDSIDNVKGVPKYGKKRTDTLLNPLKGDEFKLFDAVQKLYKDDERLLKNGRLLWIRRYKDELWSHPGYGEQ